jgi:hypothetical protein
MSKKNKTTSKAASEKPAAPKPAVEKPPKAAKQKKASGLDMAAQVLKDAGEAMDCKTVVERMLSKGLWKTGGKTPAATIYSAILREIQKKGKDARFKKVERGKFEFVG